MFPLQNTKTVNVIKQGSIATNASATGVIDTLGFDEVAIDVWLDSAASTSNVIGTCKVQECDTSNGTFTDIVALTGGTATSTSVGFVLPTAVSTNVGQVYRLNVDCRGKKRWLKPIVTPPNAALIIGLTATLGKAEVASVGRSAMGSVADG